MTNNVVNASHESDCDKEHEEKPVVSGKLGDKKPLRLILGKTGGISIGSGSWLVSLGLEEWRWVVLNCLHYTWFSLFILISQGKLPCNVITPVTSHAYQ